MSLLTDRCLIAKDPKLLHKIIEQQELMIPTIWPSIPRQQTGLNSNPASFYYLWCWCLINSSYCWCPGSLQPQVNSSHDIGYIGKAGPLISWGSILTTCIVWIAWFIQIANIFSCFLKTLHHSKGQCSQFCALVAHTNNQPSTVILYPLFAPSVDVQHKSLLTWNAQHLTPVSWMDVCWR